MSIVDRYQDRVLSMYLKTHPNADPDKVRTLIKNFTDVNLRDIPCTMHNNITHETIETSMTETFDWIARRNPIITGNGTFFKQHAEYLSPTVKMLSKLQKDRDDTKHEMYQYDKGTIEYINKDIKQKSIKVIMNADYGGSGTVLSPFYSCYIPAATTSSAKNLTTSLICCLEFISGNNNQWVLLNNVNELFDMIFTVLEDNRTDRVFINDTYTVNEVAEWLLSKVNNVIGADRRLVYQYLSTLMPEELTKLMLAFNVRLVLRKYVVGEINQIATYLKAHQVDIENISEESLLIGGYGKKSPPEIADAIERVSKIIVDNCVYPFIPNDCEIRANNMKRIIVCVTDTDSLMVHFTSFVEDFQMSDAGTFRDNCITASAFGMRLFIEHIIPRMVENYTIFCNINDKTYRDMFIFKNEFAFLAMALIAKKMYAASMFVQEGNPRDPHDIAITGLSFKKRDSPEFLEPIMIDIYDKYILTGDKIDISAVLDKFYSLRNELKQRIGTDPSFYKVLTLKDINSYDPNKVLPEQMRGAIVWNNIMKDEELLPMDRVIVIPLSFKLLHEKESLDPNIHEILRLSLIDNKDEKTNPFICLPEHYHSIPSWVQPVIDIEYAVDKLLLSFKQLFEAFDVYVSDTRAGMIPSRMVFI